MNELAKISSQLDIERMLARIDKIKLVRLACKIPKPSVSAFALPPTSKPVLWVLVEEVEIFHQSLIEDCSILCCLLIAFLASLHSR